MHEPFHHPRRLITGTSPVCQASQTTARSLLHSTDHHPGLNGLRCVPEVWTVGHKPRPSGRLQRLARRCRVLPRSGIRSRSGLAVIRSTHWRRVSVGARREMAPGFHRISLRHFDLGIIAEYNYSVDAACMTYWMASERVLDEWNDKPLYRVRRYFDVEI